MGPLEPPRYGGRDRPRRRREQPIQSQRLVLRSGALSLTRKTAQLGTVGEELCVLVRNALPHLGGLNFVLDNALKGGLNTWLNLDGFRN